ncbi:hypothetical protein EYF80_025145 [Liparis tanakae]|uniref:Uncharacterized protein n=1 Tax=Liparis tanakae TaxID=230148 RepID=A0A4Z2HFY6_9TELE|nr:hypothetical protein EYF80_025145 [Liparis tanakae]
MTITDYYLWASHLSAGPAPSPEQQVLPWDPGAQGVALALQDVAVDLGVVGHRLHGGRLAQAPPPPQLPLPQQPMEQLLLGGLHLHGAAPHPQEAAVIHLQEETQDEDIRMTDRWNSDGARQTAMLVGVIWFSSTHATTSRRNSSSVRSARRFSSGRSKMAAWAAASCWSLGKSGAEEKTA